MLSKLQCHLFTTEIIYSACKTKHHFDCHGLWQRFLSVEYTHYVWTYTSLLQSEISPHWCHTMLTLNNNTVQICTVPTCRAVYMLLNKRTFVEVTRFGNCAAKRWWLTVYFAHKLFPLSVFNESTYSTIALFGNVFYKGPFDEVLSM